MHDSPCAPLSRQAGRKIAPKLPARHRQLSNCQPSIVGSADLEVFCGFFAAVGGDLVLNDLALIEGTQTRALNSGNVNKYVLAAALRLNESISLGGIEPLHRSFSHLGLLALSLWVHRTCRCTIRQ